MTDVPNTPPSRSPQPWPGQPFREAADQTYQASLRAEDDTGDHGMTPTPEMLSFGGGYRDVWARLARAWPRSARNFDTSASLEARAADVRPAFRKALMATLQAELAASVRPTRTRSANSWGTSRTGAMPLRRLGWGFVAAAAAAMLTVSVTGWWPVWPPSPEHGTPPASQPFSRQAVTVATANPTTQAGSERTVVAQQTQVPSGETPGVIETADDDMPAAWEGSPLLPDGLSQSLASLSQMRHQTEALEHAIRTLPDGLPPGDGDAATDATELALGDFTLDERFPYLKKTFEQTLGGL